MTGVLDGFRDPEVARKLVDAIRETATVPCKLMEVCGTHTMAIAKHGLRGLMPETITLLSGPGCPVCVTANPDIDLAIEIARQPGVVLTTFGDMMKVPGSYSSLSREKADGRDVKNSNDLPRIITALRPGQQVKLVVWRKGAQRELRPAEEEVPRRGTRLLTKVGVERLHGLGVLAQGVAAEAKRRADISGVFADFYDADPLNPVSALPIRSRPRWALLASSRKLNSNLFSSLSTRSRSRPSVTIRSRELRYSSRKLSRCAASLPTT